MSTNSTNIANKNSLNMTSSRHTQIEMAMAPPSNFLLLPREIRDLIYEEFIFTHHETKVSPPSITERPSITHLHLRRKIRNTSLMFVNHQVRAEYEEQVYRHSTYQIRASYLDDPLDLMPRRSISKHCKLHLRHLELRLDFVSVPFWGNAHIGGGASPHVRRYLNLVVAKCMAELPALETLSVRFYYPTTLLVSEKDAKMAKVCTGQLLDYKPPAIVYSHLKNYRVAVFIQGSKRLGFATHKVSKRR